MIRWLRRASRTLRRGIASPLAWLAAPAVLMFGYAMFRLPPIYVAPVIMTALFGLWTLIAFIVGIAVGANLTWRRQEKQPPVTLTSTADYDRIMEDLQEEEEREENRQMQDAGTVVGFDY